MKYGMSVSEAEYAHSEFTASLIHYINNSKTSGDSTKRISDYESALKNTLIIEIKNNFFRTLWDSSFTCNIFTKTVKFSNQLITITNFVDSFIVTMNRLVFFY